jgi:hypothetical protein
MIVQTDPVAHLLQLRRARAQTSARGPAASAAALRPNGGAGRCLSISEAVARLKLPPRSPRFSTAARCTIRPSFTNLHWSLYGVPDQIDREETQEQYWELQRFLVLALKANPNVLECLYTPLVEKITPLGEELLAMRSSFLSRLVFQTYNGYVASQFKKMQADIRNQGQVKWKHVMHLIRLLISGIRVLRDGFVPVRMDEYRDRLLAVRRGEVAWEETEKWRLSLHHEFDEAVQQTSLPERPDYERANALLLKARRLALREELP